MDDNSTYINWEIQFENFLKSKTPYGDGYNLPNDTITFFSDHNTETFLSTYYSNGESSSAIPIFFLIAYSQVQNRHNLVKLLLRKGINPDTIDQIPNSDAISTYSCLLLAISGHDIVIMQILLENGANPNYKIGIKTCLGYSLACVENHPNMVECIKLLLDYGANPDEIYSYTEFYHEDENLYPLHKAVTIENINLSYQIIHLLLNHGANSIIKNTNGHNALYILYSKFKENTIKRQEIIKLLHDYGCTIDDKIKEKAISEAKAKKERNYFI